RERSTAFTSKSSVKKTKKNSILQLFISHSSRDADMAAALIDFLRVTIPGLNRIRCTSVSGYGLQAGAHVDSQLQKEVGEAATLIALMTGVSVESAYVLFEVGARWGAG